MRTPAREAEIIRGLRRKERSAHAVLRSVYAEDLREDKERVPSRRERVSLSWFRTGHHTGLRRWQKMVGKAESAKYRLCGAREESSEHVWMGCSEMADLRARHGLGEDMRELTRSPVLATALLSKMLRRLGE